MAEELLAAVVQVQEVVVVEVEEFAAVAVEQVELPVEVACMKEEAAVRIPEEEVEVAVRMLVVDKQGVLRSGFVVVVGRSPEVEVVAAVRKLVAEDMDKEDIRMEVAGCKEARMDKDIEDIGRIEVVEEVDCNGCCYGRFFCLCYLCRGHVCCLCRENQSVFGFLGVRVLPVRGRRLLLVLIRPCKAVRLK